MAVTRIQNNQIFDKTITYAKIADGTLVGTLFNPNLTLNSNVIITGNLSVIGDSSTISSTNTYVNDPLVVFNNGFTGTPLYDVGIVVNRNLNPINVAWIWDEGNDQFVGIFTTETGGTVGSMNKTGYTTVKVGNIAVVSTATIANISIANNTVTATGNLILDPTGSVNISGDVLPAANATYAIGQSGLQFTNVFTGTATVGTAVVTTNAGDLTITPPPGGNTVVANLVIAGSNSTFTGNIVSGNVQITGGNINGTTIGATVASDATFTSITDTGALTANGAGATISLQPTGAGTVTINPATVGTISNMAGSFTTLSSSSTTTLAATSATSLSTSNLQATGGNISGTAITTSPISGSSGSFTTLQTSANTTLGGTLVSVSANLNITSTVQSTDKDTGALVLDGGLGVEKDVSVGGNLRVTQTSTLGNIVVAAHGISSTGNVELSATGAVKIGAVTLPQVDGSAGDILVTNGAGVVSFQSVGGATQGNVIPLGTPTTGTLVDNSPAILTFTTATKVTDAVDQLNEILGKLVPPQPPVFPNATTLAVSSTSSGLRMTDFVQTDNTLSGSHSLAGGSTVSAYRRAASYATNVINDVGPGSSGNVQVVKNGTVSGSHVMVESFVGGNNGTYGELVITDNADYGTKTSTALLFWTSFDATASGTVAAGWNEVAMTDTAGTSTNTPVWYYDSSAPGTPVVTSSTFAVTTPVTSFSSNVPHYTSSTVWTGTGTATRLSGDLYPASNTFLTGVSGGSFGAPASVTYSGAGVTTPLARNLYVASGSASFSTTVNTINTTGSSSAAPSYSVANSYATGSGSASPGGTVLTIKANDTAVVDENYIAAGTFGTGGSATAVRIGGLATGATPTLSGMAAWSSAAAMATYEAAVVAGVLSRNQTNYSTGYFPIGPDLSGQAATQYATFRITRDAVSKFDIAVTGKFSACHVAMPGSSLDTTAAPTNGWIDATVSYGGSGVPGTGSGGNGSAGCALGGTLTVGSNVTQSKTVTFGTESSNNSTGNYIYVRFTLAATDSITALSFANPTH